MSQDRSRQKRFALCAEAVLKESEERFRLIADSAPVPMWVTQLDRNRSFVNRAYLDFLKVDYDAALAFDWRSILHPDDHDRIVAESIAGEALLQPFVLEARYRRGDGNWRWLRSESQPRWGPDGAHIGFIGLHMMLPTLERPRHFCARASNAFANSSKMPTTSFYHRSGNADNVVQSGGGSCTRPQAG